MKKRICETAFCVVMILLVTFFGHTDTGVKQYEPTRVTVILPHKDDGYWDYVWKGIEEMQEEAVKYRIDIKVVFPQLNYNVEQMTELLKKQTAAKVDIVIVQGNENEAFKEALGEAYAQGTKVILVDTDIKDFPPHLFIGSDNYESGRILGEQAVRLTGGKGKVVLISGEEEYLNMQMRRQGFLDAVSTCDGLEVVGTYYDHYDGLTFMRLFQELSGEADVLVNLEGTGGRMLKSVYDSHPWQYRYILAHDYGEGVTDGITDGSVVQREQEMGSRAVEEIIRYVTTGEFVTGDIYTEIVGLTREGQ